MIIKDVFQFACGIVIELSNGYDIIKIGDKIEVKNPDGTLLEATIIGYELCSRKTSIHNRTFGLLIRGLTKQQIQIGAEVKRIAL